MKLDPLHKRPTTFLPSKMPNSQSSELLQGEKNASQEQALPRRDLWFWLVILAICLCTFMFALELCAVPTALPVIVNALDGSQFIWIGSAYTLASTAWLPMSGRLAEIYGRRPIMLISLLIFAAGSALAGAAPSMHLLIVARTIQGLGGGGIASLSQIIISDLVPLRERGAFNGLLGVAYTFGVGLGPIIGGSLADRGQWRWLFYLNVPICGLCFILVLLFLRLRTPPGTAMEKFKKFNWIGNFLVISSTTATVIALTWGGVQYRWSSAHVLVPLVLGILGLALFFFYEGAYAKDPMVPFGLMSTITGLSGYLQTFFVFAHMIGILYYFPVFFQACQDDSPTQTGINMLVISLTTNPFSIIAGLSITKSGKYRAQLWLGWVIAIIGYGLLSTLKVDSNKAHSMGYQVLLGAGAGLVISTTYFPVLAPLPTSANAAALALFIFMRNFAQVWGVTIGGTVLQNQLSKRLPTEFVAHFPQGTAIAYAVIPTIKTLPEPLRTEVKVAFQDSLQVVWYVLVGVSALGLLVSLPMTALPLHTSVDRKWGLTEEKGAETLNA